MALLLLMLVIMVSFLILARQNDLRLALVEMTAASAVAVLALAGFLAALPRARWRCWPLVILLTSVLLRLLFVPRPPQLSDDLYRYLWDGLQLVAGVNPYALPPALAVPSSPLAAQWQPLINHPQLVTLYPPVAQLLFALAGGSLLGWKLLLLACDIATLGLLMALLRRVGQPAALAALYGWHPLAVIEGAASAHLDLAALPLLLLALWLLLPAPGRAAPGAVAGSGLALALAGGIKLVPLLLAPLLLVALAPGRRWLFGLVAAGAVLLPAGLFWPELGNGLQTLGQYARHWEFAALPFRLLRALLADGLTARLLLATLLLLILAGLLLWLRQAAGQPAVALGQAAAVLLLAFALLTPTLHPWYLLYPLVLAPLAPPPVRLASFVLGWSGLLGYQVVTGYALHGQWQESTRLAAYIFSAPAMALMLALMAALLRRYRRQPI